MDLLTIPALKPDKSIYYISYPYWNSFNDFKKLSDKEDIEEDAKISKYELKFKYAVIDEGLFVFGLRDVSYSGGALERTNSGFTLVYQHKFYYS